MHPVMIVQVTKSNVHPVMTVQVIKSNVHASSHDSTSNKIKCASSHDSTSNKYFLQYLKVLRQKTKQLFSVYNDEELFV